MSICFERVWNPAFIVYSIVPQLSTKMEVGASGFSPSSVNSCRIHTFSWVAFDKAMYSASILDNATVGCFLELHVVAPPESIDTYPEIDRLSSILLPQSASEYNVMSAVSLPE